MSKSIRLLTLVVAAAFEFVASPSPGSSQDAAPGLPGSEHDILTSLVGSWDVYVADRLVGTAIASSRLYDRFVEVEIVAEEGPIGHAIYTFGFDRRHSHYTVVAMDDTGTYWVTASGAREETSIAMYGQDEDPAMRAMGLDKEFVIVLNIQSGDRVTIETRFIDTRTPERREMSFHTFELRRGS